MLARLWALPALLALACGGADNQPEFDGAFAGAGGSGASAAGSGQQGGTDSAVAGSSSAAGAGAATGGDGSVAGTAGEAQGGTGAAAGSETSGGAGAAHGGTTAAGSGGSGNAQAGAAPQAGSGGQGGDALAPQPVPGCPGYVKVLIPHGTCVWFHGSFTYQTPQCNDPAPPEKKCATASAVSSDITSIVSSTAEISRFDFGDSGCPKTCN